MEALSGQAPSASPSALMSKRALLVASHAIERAFQHSDIGPEPEDGSRPATPRDDAGLLIGFFQRRGYFDVEATRYASLAAAGHTVIVAFTGSVQGLPHGVHGVSLDEDDPLARDWVLALVRGSFGASIIARDNHLLAPTESTMEAGRLFIGRTTLRRRTALEDARTHLLRLVDRLPASVVARARVHIAASARQPFSVAEDRVALAADHLVRSVDAGYQAAMLVGLELETTKSTAERDQLTGLHNRHYLERYLGEGERPADLMALLVDVDGLKGVNDAHGHPAGDALLCAVAAALRASTRPTDVVVRWGGDEFLILVPHLDDAAGLRYGQRLAQAVSESRPEPPWEHLLPSVSVGVCPTTHTPLPLKQLDAALYGVKRGGRGHAALARRERA